MPFWVFHLTICLFLGCNWVAVTDRICFIILLISSLILFYLLLSRYLSLQHNWWTSNWHRI